MTGGRLQAKTEDVREPGMENGDLLKEQTTQVTHQALGMYTWRMGDTLLTWIRWEGLRVKLRKGMIYKT